MEKSRHTRFAKCGAVRVCPSHTLTLLATFRSHLSGISGRDPRRANSHGAAFRKPCMAQFPHLPPPYQNTSRPSVSSPFWLILLLLEGDPEHPRIILAAPGLPQKDADQCSAIGVKRTCRFALQMSAFDPKRTSVAMLSFLIRLPPGRERI